MSTTEKTKQEKESRAKELLVGLGLAAIVAAGGTTAYLNLWDTHVAVEATKGRDVNKIKDKQVEKQYCGHIKNPLTEETFYSCTNAKLEEVKTGLLNNMIILKYCGTVSEKLEKCPEWPAEQLSSCCCVPPLVVVDDCFCGTIETVVDADTGETQEKEIFSSTDRALQCTNGYVTGGQETSCVVNDPSLNCVVWPMNVMSGENPGKIAKQKTVENEGE